MSFRCINAFAYNDVVYPNGYQVEDADAILKTHAEHFAEVEVGFTARAVEQAEAKPEGLRATPKKKSAAKAAPKIEPKSEPKGNDNA